MITTQKGCDIYIQQCTCEQTNNTQTNIYMTGQKEKLERIGNPVPHPLGSGKNTMVSPWLAHASLFSSTTSRRLVAGQTSGGENYEAKLPVTTPMVNTKKCTW